MYEPIGSKNSGIDTLEYLKKRFKHPVNYFHFGKTINEKIAKYGRHNNLSLLHFYDFVKGYPKNGIKSKNWLKDPNLVLKSIFTDGMNMDRTILIYPNGDFFVGVMKYFSYSNRKLLNRRLFERQRKKWEKEYRKIEVRR